MQSATLYKLIDPRDGVAKYIGVTTSSLRLRLQHHTSRYALGMTSPKAKWIREMLDSGFSPVIEEMESGPLAKMASLEKELIKAGRDRLLNRYLGGGLGRRSEAARKRMSESHIGKPQPWKYRSVIRSDGAVFASVNEAANASSIPRRSISNCLNGWARTAGGFSWRFQGR
jgi:hypothetical protein